MLAVLLALAGCVWLFVELADEIDEGETDSLDARILLALRNPADPADPLGPGWIEEFGRDVTALGGIGILTFLTLAAAGFLCAAAASGARCCCSSSRSAAASSSAPSSSAASTGRVPTSCRTRRWSTPRASRPATR